MSEIPERLWLPLYMMEISGTIYTKIKLQKLTFLAEYYSKSMPYDFRKHHYGPFSDTLDLDTSCFSNLIKHNVVDSMYNHNRQYHTYALTEEGKKQLTILKSKINTQLLDDVKNIVEKYGEKNSCDLLDEVYEKFALRPEDSTDLEGKVINEFQKVIPPITSCYSTLKNGHATFLLSTLEIVDIILKSLKGITDTVQKGVILNLSREIIQKCCDLSKDIIMPNVNSISLRPKFIELIEIESFLREYCDTRGITKDPLKMTLEESITEEEADRLSQALKEVHVPA